MIFLGWWFLAPIGEHQVFSVALNAQTTCNLGKSSVVGQNFRN